MADAIPSPHHCRPAAYALFASQVAALDSTAGLVRAAVAVAMHEMEEADAGAVEAELQSLAGVIRSRVRGPQPSAVLAHAHEVLFEEEGFLGNTEDYDDPFNSYLPAVLRTKRGIPISLCLLYKAVLERVGIRAEGINAPLHFLVRVEAEGSAMLVDPFHGGRCMSREEALQRIGRLMNRPVLLGETLLPVASHPQWLIRMLNNLILVFEQSGREEDRAAMLELRGLLGVVS